MTLQESKEQREALQRFVNIELGEVVPVRELTMDDYIHIARGCAMSKYAGKKLLDKYIPKYSMTIVDMIGRQMDYEVLDVLLEEKSKIMKKRGT